MKKIVAIGSIAIAVIVFTYCSPSKKAAAPVPVAVAKVSYESKVAPILMANCTPCHFPDKGGRKKPIDNYNAASAQVDDILRRIQLNTTDRGFMPDRKPKLADSTIAILKQWKEDGLVK